MALAVVLTFADVLPLQRAVIAVSVPLELLEQLFEAPLKDAGAEPVRLHRGNEDSNRIDVGPGGAAASDRCLNQESSAAAEGVKDVLTLFAVALDESSYDRRVKLRWKAEQLMR
jgi:hypothetical protein